MLTLPKPAKNHVFLLQKKMPLRGETHAIVQECHSGSARIAARGVFSEMEIDIYSAVLALSCHSVRTWLVVPEADQEGQKV